MSKEAERYLLSMQELAGYYVASDADSVLQHAKKLVGLTLRPYLDTQQLEYALSPRGKGDFGNLLEEAYFKIRNNNEPGPDIPESSVEIKSAQLKLVGRYARKAFKERLKISMIDYHESFQAENLLQSYLWAKLEKILLMLFMWGQPNRIDQECVWADFLLWDEDDIKQMSSDWGHIKKMVLDGRADQLSEGATWYLGACTAGSSSAATRSAPGGIVAKARAFSLKPPFLNYKLGLAPTVKRPKAVFTAPGAMTLDEYLLQNMRVFYGRSLDDLARFIHRPQLLERFSKNMNAKITRALLEEIAATRTDALDTDFSQFRKGGVVERTVALEPKGTLRESISFPAFKWTELVREDEWEDSDLYQLLTTKFFFTVLQKREQGQPILLGCFFWTMSEDDLIKMKTLWEDTKAKVAKGDYGRFIQKTEHPVGHVRPHAQNADDTYITPQGHRETKKSFWLNNDYVLGIIKANLGL